MSENKEPRDNKVAGSWNDSPLPAYDELKSRIPDIEYWRERAKQLEQAKKDRGEEYIQRIKENFELAIQDFEVKISQFYSRFADFNNITYQEAQKYLSDPQLAQFHMTLERYIELGQSLNVQFDNDVWSEMENASIRYRVTRLQALQTELKARLELLYNEVDADIYECLANQYVDAYYRTTFDIFQGYGIGVDFSMLDEDSIDTMMSNPWRDGSDFSSKVWYQKRKLLDELPRIMIQAVIQGKSYSETSKELADRMNKSRFHAEVLVRTESAFFSTQGELESYQELYIKEYQNIAVLDNRTTEICQDMDLTHFKVTEAQPWVTCPPFNYQCRTTTVPYNPKIQNRLPEYVNAQKRAARGKDGKTYYVPATMNYHDWAKTKNALIPKDYEEKFRTRHQLKTLET